MDRSHTLHHTQPHTAHTLTSPVLCCLPLSHCRVHDIEAKYYADGEDAYDMRKYLRKKGNRVTAPPPRIEQLSEIQKEKEQQQQQKEQQQKEQKEQTDGETKAAAAEGKDEKDGGGKTASGEEDKKKDKKKKKKGKGGKDESVAKEKVDEKPVELAKQDIGAVIAALQLQAKKAKQKS